MTSNRRDGITKTILCGTAVLSFWSDNALAQANIDPAHPPASGNPRPTATLNAPEINQTREIDEIVVTARKQAESLFDVPVAAEILDSETLMRNAITDVSDLGSLVASVNFDKTLGGGTGSLTIRGIGSSSFDTGIEQAVATVIDGVQISRGQFVQAGLLDLAQVEVLKGPQALFFGKNSPGGVLVLSSRGPTEYLEGYVRVGYEFRANETIAEVAVSGPLGEDFGVRLAISGSDLSGYIRNVAAPVANPFAAIPGNSPMIDAPPYNKNDSREIVGRITLEYAPASPFSATLRLLGNASEDRGNTSGAEITNCAMPPNASSLGVFDPATDCNIDDRQSIGPIPPQIASSHPVFRDGTPYGRYQAYLASLTLNYEAGPINITSVTGYVDLGYERTLSNNTVYAYPAVGFDEQFSQFSQELRANSNYDGPVNFSAGVYYDQFDLYTLTANALFPAPADPATGSFLSYIITSNNSGKSYSAFGQIRWDILDNLELAAGARYTHDVRRGRVGNDFLSANAGIPLTPEGMFFAGERSYDDVSPEVTLSWEPTENTLVYGAYKTGYKSGGASALAILPVTFDPADGLFYDPEEIKGFEIGFKTALLDDRLQISSAAYTYEYLGLQVSNTNQATFEVEALNVGALRTKGVELAATYRPIDPLTLDMSVGYSRARYTDFSGIACYAGQTVAAGCQSDGSQDLTGQQKYRSPDWSGTAGVTYVAGLTSDLNLTLGGRIRFSSSYFTQENNSPFAFQKGYQLFDAFVQFGPTDETWQLSLIGRNLGNERYAIASIDNPNSLPGTIESQVNRPRQIMVQGMFRF